MWWIKVHRWNREIACLLGVGALGGLDLTSRGNRYKKSSQVIHKQHETTYPCVFRLPPVSFYRYYSPRVCRTKTLPVNFMTTLMTQS